jgi:hypothetical protein
VYGSIWMASKSAIALPAALWVSQTLDWELAKVPKSERQSMLRLMQVFSEHSDRPELPDDAVLRRAFKTVSASHIQALHENAELKRRIADLQGSIAEERRQMEALAVQNRGDLATTRTRADQNAKLVEEWKKRCAGWKRTAMNAEHKYKRLAALAQSKLSINPAAVKDATASQPDAADLDMDTADATLAKLTDVPKAVVKPSAGPRTKMRPFRLGDDINPPKSFGEREQGRRHGVKMGAPPSGSGGASRR